MLLQYKDKCQIWIKYLAQSFSNGCSKPKGFGRKDSSLISENPLLPKIDDSLIKEISIDNENYIFSRTMLTEDSKVYMDKIEYFDGLGRPKETIFDKASPSKQKSLPIRSTMIWEE